jgi:hypothetical protein
MSNVSAGCIRCRLGRKVLGTAVKCDHVRLECTDRAAICRDPSFDELRCRLIYSRFDADMLIDNDFENFFTSLQGPSAQSIRTSWNRLLSAWRTYEHVEFDSALFPCNIICVLFLLYMLHGELHYPDEKSQSLQHNHPDIMAALAARHQIRCLDILFVQGFCSQ